MITKSIQLIPKDIDLSKREAVLAHATYKTLDKDGDKSNRGMFDKSWSENMGLIRYFLNHDKKQAPGKAIQVWDDNEHAYTRVKHGTHTLGEDVMKMLDEGVIMGVSFGFEPLRFKDIKGKGKDFLEVKHYETSVLTHWGAHDDSRVVSVTKEADLYMASITRMEKFIRNTTASDESIAVVMKELTNLKSILNKNSDTVSTSSAVQCPKCKTYSAGGEEPGSTKCAECGYVIAGSPEASRSKDELRKKMLLLKAKMAINSDD